MLPKPTGRNMYGVIRPKVITQAISRRSMRRRSVHITAGHQQRNEGDVDRQDVLRRNATTSIRPISSHLTLPPLAPWRSTIASALSARAWARPDLAMATANAPSSA
jgi:hypothetical protein